MKTFEDRWEEFRIDKEMPEEWFISKGYGFVEDLEDFVKLEMFGKDTRIKELEAEVKIEFYSKIEHAQTIKQAIEMLEDSANKAPTCRIMKALEILKGGEK